MGAGYMSQEFDGNLTKEQLLRRFAEFQSEQEYEHGHCSYNGTLSTTEGLTVEDRVFDNIEEADGYIADNTEKWGTALAVRVRAKKVAFKKEPTFDGKRHSETKSPPFIDIDSAAFRTYYCSRSRDYVDAPADQCSAVQKARLTKLWEAYSSSISTAGKLQDELNNLSIRFRDISWEMTPQNYRRLKVIRSELRRADAKYKKAKERFVEFERKLSERLFPRDHKATETNWLVGGWCSS
jgi:hypothetical protein